MRKLSYDPKVLNNSTVQHHAKTLLELEVPCMSLCKQSRQKTGVATDSLFHSVLNSVSCTAISVQKDGRDWLLLALDAVFDVLELPIHSARCHSTTPVNNDGEGDQVSSHVALLLSRELQPILLC